MSANVRVSEISDKQTILRSPHHDDRNKRPPGVASAPFNEDSPANWPSTGWASFVTTSANAGSPLGPTANPCPKSGPSSSGSWTPATASSRWARPTTTWRTAFAKMTPPTPKCCWRPSSPRTGNMPPTGPLADGHTWQTPTPGPPYEWDEAKRRQNIEMHRIDFTLVYRVNWAAATHQRSDRRGELRYSSYIPIDDRLHHIVWTPREHYTRIISFRKANLRETVRYDREKT